MMEEKVKRYCPQCGASFVAEKEKFSKRRRCPSCNEIVSFEEVVNNPPEIPSEPVFPLNPIFYVLNAALGVLLVILAIYSLSLLMAGKMTILVATSVVFFAISIPGLIAYFQQYQQATKALSQHRELKKHNQELTAKINEFAERYQGLSKNFDALLQDYKNQYLESLLTRENRKLATSSKSMSNGSESLISLVSVFSMTL